ncbi:MAG: GPW/gp25 family protein [Pseudomonadota bacterium]
MEEGNGKPNFLGRGWAFPVVPDGAGNIQLASDEEDIRQAILLILRTNPGERVMLPEFGAGLDGIIFGVINQSTVALVRHRVEQALVLWEPRIDRIEIQITAAPRRGLLTIEISYRIRATNTFYNLVYPFEVEEAAI